MHPHYIIKIFTITREFYLLNLKIHTPRYIPYRNGAYEHKEICKE